jgi:predicted DCC family thiol-disulfide oxidoreductase YuxK
MNAQPKPEVDRASQPAKDELTLIYDGKCPVCTAYSCGVDVDSASASSVRIVDARGDDAMIKLATATGLDFDEGMVVSYRGKFYHGADALHVLATLAPAKGIWNRINRFLFGSRAVSRFLYPMLRSGRNLLLRLLGRKKIRNLETRG